MKAAVFKKPGELKVREVNVPEHSASEVLVEVKHAGVCGTDIHIVDGTSDSSPPVIPGHEYVGTVYKTGSAVENFNRGDRVVIDPNINCGKCYFCRRGKVNLCENLKALGVHRDGGFAEYSAVPEKQLYLYPKDKPLKWGIFVEPLSCVLHGLDLLDLKPPSQTVVIGAGAIGLIFVQLLKFSGGLPVIVLEIKEERRKIAEELGADAVINPRKEDALKSVRNLTGGGAEVVIECAGTAETADLAINLAKKGGTVEFFGVCGMDEEIRMKPYEIYSRELTIRGSFVNPFTFRRAIELISDGIVEFSRFNTKEFPLTSIPEAFEWHRKNKTVKTAIKME